MLSAKRSSTNALAIVGAAAVAVAGSAIALAVTGSAVALVALIVAVLAAGVVAVAFIIGERRRHETVEAENARLLAEAQEREAERARLADHLVSAEQDERRRLALFLHDGPVQSLSGIALMLDAAQAAIDAERLDEAKGVVSRALERHRDTIRSLRDLSFNIEPVVLRDQGFEPAVRALADQLANAHGISFELDVAAAEALSERAQAALYQILREALGQAILRGPPRRVAVSIRETTDHVETTIADDGAGERRRRSVENITERARTLGGSVDVGPGPDGGTVVRVRVPAYAARR